MTNVVDIRWPIQVNGRIPLQHQYLLLAAISRLVPEVHESKSFGIHPIRGLKTKPGYLDLTPASALRIRVGLEHLRVLLPLSGKKLELGDCPVRLGIPQILTLQPSERMACHLTTIKGYQEEPLFAEGVRRQLDITGVRESVTIEIGSRRVLRIKQQLIVGFQVTLNGLDDSESIKIQEMGIGGRRHLGCGLFDAIREKQEAGKAASQWQKQ